MVDCEVRLTKEVRRILADFGWHYPWNKKIVRLGVVPLRFTGHGKTLQIIGPFPKGTKPEDLPDKFYAPIGPKAFLATKAKENP